MLNITGRYVSVFEVEDQGKFAKCNLTSSKKNKDESYTNCYWKARLVGEAFKKSKELKDKDKINIKKGIVENQYDKENKKSWVTVTIFDYELEN